MERHGPHGIVKSDNANKECLFNILKQWLKTTLYETNNQEIIDTLYVNLVSMVTLLPFVLNTHILGFLNTKERASMAVICKDFYKIHTELTKYDYNAPFIELSVDCPCFNNMSFYCDTTRLSNVRKMFKIQLQNQISE